MTAVPQRAANESPVSAFRTCVTSGPNKLPCGEQKLLCGEKLDRTGAALG